MGCWHAPYILLLIFANTQIKLCYGKGSLTYVIDTTPSMTAEINQVKASTDSITRVVFEEKSSQIQNMVLVTFSDPNADLRIVTENRDVFKRKINEVFIKWPNVYDCPEMSMAGVLLALQTSLPGSFIYVFTDASAKDHYKSNQVLSMCQEKQSQIVFILTGDCRDYERPRYQVYYDIAAACSGLAFYVKKEEVFSIFEPIKDAIKGKKEMITSRTIPAHVTKDIPFDISDETEYATVTASGVNVVLQIKKPQNSNAIINRMTWLSNVKMFQVSRLTPGRYIATVSSSSLTTINIYGRTDFGFEYGFSGLEAKTLADTIPRPIANTATRLFISVTDPNHTTNITSAVILDMNEKVIASFNLPLQNVYGNYYQSPSFIAPSSIFKLAVFGKAASTGKDIRRLAKFPITPMQIPEKVYAPKTSGKTSEKVKMGSPANINCIVTNAVPAPKITWQFMANGKSNFVQISGSNSVLHIAKAGMKDAGRYKCIASNIAGISEHVTNLEVEYVPYINSNNPKTYNARDGDATLSIPCGAVGVPPPTISWLVNGKPITPGPHYSISGNNLIINNPKMADTGSYTCEAKNYLGSVKAKFDVKVKGIPYIAPKNSKPPEAREGDAMLTIPCGAVGVPPPIISWSVNGKPITDGPHYSISGDNLIIKDPKMADTGSYRCEAKNDLGSTRADYNVNVKGVPYINPKDPKSFNGKEGDAELKVPCKAVGNPTPTISWSINGKSITSGPHYSISGNTLIIKNPKMVDTGSYKCDAKNSLGSTHDLFDVKVKGVPRINSNNSKIHQARDGDKDLRIPCGAVGVPPPTVTWSVHGKPIKSGPNYSMSGDTLIIKNPKMTDTGSYRCEAKNDFGSAHVDIKVNVDGAPYINSKATKNFEGKEGDGELRISCGAVGIPPPTISWSINGKPITTGPHYTMTGDMLIIKDPKMGDTGSYRCDAKNYMGSANGVVDVKVKGVPYIKPNNSDTIKARDGDAALKIPCGAVGVPPPTITWSVNGKPITNGPHYSISGDTLTIKNPKMMDTGSYRCDVKNNMGSTHADIKVNVDGVPYINSKASKKIEGKEGDAALRIPCGAVGVPPPTITWYLHGKPITAGPHYSISGDTLIIKNPKMGDTGSYRCDAKNYMGSAQSVLDVKVNGVPYIKPSNSDTIKARDGDAALKIPCGAVGVPPPTIAWTVNGKPITNGPHYTISGDTLIIKNPKMMDTGKYRCDAKNNMGSSHADIKVNVDGVPYINSKASKDIEGQEGDAALRIPCGAVGVPPPTISWSIHGKPINAGPHYSISGDFLIIKNPIMGDTGSYKCDAKNYMGSAQGVLDVKVKGVPYITPNNSDTIKARDSDATLRIPCGAIGVPPPTRTWSVNGKPITNGPHYTISGDTLIIKNPKMMDTGKYRCDVKNNMGSTHTDINVNVEGVPYINAKDSKTFEGQEGDAVLRIPCGAVGVPRPTISWSVNGKPIATGPHYSISGDTLVIKNPKMVDTGSYRCDARNYLGSAQGVFDVKVKGIPYITSNNSKNYKAREGDTALRIPCGAVGVPPPTVTWSVNGKPVANGPHYSISGDTLVVRDPKMKDSGSYRCEAKNNMGSTHADLNVNVEGVPYINPNNPKTHEALDGDSTVSIPCGAIGVPPPTITWSVNGKPIKPGPRYSISGDNLIIRNPKMVDTASYRCDAKNYLGSTHGVINVNIKGMPYITSNVSKLYEGIVGDVALRIPCEVVGVPPATISWSANGKPITPGRHFSIIGNALVIKDPKVIDSGSYRCQATNSLGSTHAVFKASVKEYPDDYGIIETVKINVLENPTYRLACGLPGQSVRWFVERTDTNVRGNFFDLTNFDDAYNGNYTCRVSDMQGSYMKTFRLVIGSPPKFEFEYESEPNFDWNGNDNNLLDCSVEDNYNINVDWVYNGKMLSDHKTLRLPVDGKWGHYTCNVTNDFGSIQRTFDVVSSNCLIPKDQKIYGNMPIILNERYTWLTSGNVANYYTVQPGEKMTLYCPNSSDKINYLKNFAKSNEITALCDRQDTFIVNGRRYKTSDLGCVQKIIPRIKFENYRCGRGHTKSVSVGYNAPSFLKTYEVCYDTFKNIPQYVVTEMPQDYQSHDVHQNWYKHPEIQFPAKDSVYTCKSSTSTCCYSKSQLVSAKDFTDGPAQDTAFIDSINAIPLWQPCDKKESSWKNLGENIRRQLEAMPAYAIWSGTHKFQKINGDLVPRYLFKLVEFINDSPTAFVYVNGPSPTKADILCKNICDDLILPIDVDDHLYCCNAEDFRDAFKFYEYKDLKSKKNIKN